MTTERTYHDLTIAELRELALKNASPHTPRHERELSSMMLGHAMLAILPHIAELEADNARLNGIAERAVGSAVQASRAMLELQAEIAALRNDARRADNLIALQSHAIRVARTFCEERSDVALDRLIAALEEPAP